MDEPTRVYPPGPFPPHGIEREGTVDLGIRLRDVLYRRELLVGPARQVLTQHISGAVARPERLAMALQHVDLLVDTWALGSAVDEARERWVDGPDAWALAVLARCADVVSSIVGWPRAIDRRWPMPDMGWMSAQGIAQDSVVISRGPGDGAPGVAVALALPLGTPEPVPLPRVIDVPGDEVAERVDELVQRLIDGPEVAVCYTTPPPWDDETRRAMKRLREVAEQQVGFERHGVAGLLVDEVPTWDQLLQQAPKGVAGPMLRATCDTVLVPQLGDDGKVEAVGMLVWDSLYRPVGVVPGAVEVLSRLDGATPMAVVAAEIGVEEATIQHVADQLVGVGAATAV